MRNCISLTINLRNYTHTYTTCNVLGLCKRFYFAILLVWLTVTETEVSRVAEVDRLCVIKLQVVAEVTVIVE